MSDVSRLSIRGGPVTVTHHLIQVDPEAVSAAVQARDIRALYAIDREFVPFWCPECDACYCADHYRHWDEYDAGFFDCTRGRCPRGHERMLMD